MEKKIMDYLHLYLPFEFSFYGYTYKVIGFKDGGHFFHLWHEHGFFDVLKEDFKLPLRKLGDMSEEEFRESNLKTHPQFWMTDSSIWCFTAEITKFLLSKSFDLFGLIESGLAIDATKEKVQESDTTKPH